MTAPSPTSVEHQLTTGASPLVRAAIWVAIGALIAAAIVCVVWVFVGSQDGVIGRAFLTILLLVAFSGAAILDAHLAPKRPAWFALASMIGWVALLLVGVAMVWMPERTPFGGVTRIVQFLLIVLIVQLALLHIRLFGRSSRRYVTGFTQTVTVITIALVVGLAALLIAPLLLWEYLVFTDLYGRVIVATGILAAVGTALVPLVNVLLAPKQTPVPHTVSTPEPVLLPWPTYVDGVTPLPFMPDGQPDWGAYYSGFPSPGAQVVAPLAPAPQPGYAGYPPPPPLPR